MQFLILQMPSYSPSLSATISHRDMQIQHVQVYSANDDKMMRS